MAWVGANSYRTAHYPYSETDLELADEHGLLVVSESPCVGLSYADEPPVVTARQAQALRAMRELLARDATRACVVAWSVCNEPGGPKSVPTADAKRQQTAALLQLVGLAKSDASARPVTFANIPEHCDEANRACDFLSLNECTSAAAGAPRTPACPQPPRTISNQPSAPLPPLTGVAARGVVAHVRPPGVCARVIDAGWYYDVGTPLASIGEQLEAKLRRVYAEFRKPIMISECGADTLPGCHMMAPGLWSEEFQEALLLVYARLPTALPFVFGVHVWNLCDFRTPQMHIRAGGLNHKGRWEPPRSAGSKK